MIVTRLRENVPACKKHTENPLDIFSVCFMRFWKDFMLLWDYTEDRVDKKYSTWNILPPRNSNLRYALFHSLCIQSWAPFFCDNVFKNRGTVHYVYVVHTSWTFKVACQYLYLQISHCIHNHCWFLFLSFVPLGTSHRGIFPNPMLKIPGSYTSWENLCCPWYPYFLFKSVSSGRQRYELLNTSRNSSKKVKKAFHVAERLARSDCRPD